MKIILPDEKTVDLADVMDSEIRRALEHFGKLYPKGALTAIYHDPNLGRRVALADTDLETAYYDVAEGRTEQMRFFDAMAAWRRTYTDNLAAIRRKEPWTFKSE